VKCTIFRIFYKLANGPSNGFNLDYKAATEISRLAFPSCRLSHNEPEPKHHYQVTLVSLEVLPQKQVHNVLHPWTSHVPEIAFPCCRTI
jgi:hypothetical protein